MLYAYVSVGSHKIKDNVKMLSTIACVWFFDPLENFFIHMETSPLPVNGCKFCPMLGTNGQGALRVL